MPVVAEFLPYPYIRTIPHLCELEPLTFMYFYAIIVFVARCSCFYQNLAKFFDFQSYHLFERKRS